MASKEYRYFIVTGEPGVGKTTLIKKLSTLMTAKGLRTAGFYTEEVRKNGLREGFDVVSIDGSRGYLARDQSLISSTIKYRVGKYGVLVDEFEKVALPIFNQLMQSPSHIAIIDEIGKMELFSKQFKVNIQTLFNDKSKNIVVATIPARRGDSLIEHIRNHSKAKIWMITRGNRNSIHEDTFKEIEKALNIV